MKNTFNIKRLLLLIRNDLQLQRKTILITTVLFALFCAIIPINIGSTVYFFLLYTGGFLFTGSAFNEFHDRRKAYSTLLLPCSNLERFLAKWLLTAIIYTIGLLLLLFIFSLMAAIFNFLFYKQPFHLFNIIQSALWLSIGKYLILQAVVFLGAITFKKQALLKTGLVITAIFFLLNIFLGLVMWLFFPNISYDEFILRASLQGWNFLFWIVLAPFCWYLTYLKITEYELR